MMTGTMDCTQTLKQGSKGAAVKLLQQNLKALGYYLKAPNGSNLLVDGDFGDYTFDAVKSYQKKKGLYVDGVVGKQTCSNINSDIAKTSTPSSSATGTTSSSATSTAVSKDPFAPDESKNIYSPGQSNLRIDGINLIASSVKVECDEHNGNWSQLAMMDGHFHTYLSHDTAYAYTVETVLKNEDFGQLKYEFHKMGGRKCKVLSTVLQSGTYVIKVSFEAQDLTHQKVTLKLTEDY